MNIKQQLLPQELQISSALQHAPPRQQTQETRGFGSKHRPVTNMHLLSEDTASLPKRHFQNAHHIKGEESLACIFVPVALKRTPPNVGSDAAVKPIAGNTWSGASTVAPGGGLWVRLTAWWPMMSFHTYILNSRNRAENYHDPPCRDQNHGYVRCCPEDPSKPSCEHL